ncbi:MAG: O-acetyl-ADP-ribose deacetylase [Treponema sp.]|jgi:O-acetyl-ADP-ribose deacetylase (regulator of RNase III)|nr:O-acetyl-ADP-ribose deacetylase [Treponema sp.]
MDTEITAVEITVIEGDITALRADAIVNAANSSLLGGGGVDGAIHRAAGPALLEECRALAGKQGGCPAGEAVITGAGKLPCGKVIHTVGPVWRGGGLGEAELLASCYRKSLCLAESAGLGTIAFPNISTGVYGYPKAEAAEIAVKTVTETLPQLKSVKKVIFVCFDRENYGLYRKLLEGRPGGNTPGFPASGPR